MLDLLHYDFMRNALAAGLLGAQPKLAHAIVNEGLKNLRMGTTRTRNNPLFFPGAGVRVHLAEKLFSRSGKRAQTRKRGGPGHGARMSNTAIGLPTGKNIRINNPDRIQDEKSNEPEYSREVFP